MVKGDGIIALKRIEFLSVFSAQFKVKVKPDLLKKITLTLCFPKIAILIFLSKLSYGSLANSNQLFGCLSIQRIYHDSAGKKNQMISSLCPGFPQGKGCLQKDEFVTEKTIQASKHNDYLESMFLKTHQGLVTSENSMHKYAFRCK